jgi:nucleoside-diphosphate-sugar epimerase
VEALKVFVTGASGFIGSHVTRALVARGHSVAILSPSSKAPWRLQGIFGKLKRKYGKLTDLKSLRKALADFRPDACIHLAWYAEPGEYLASPENLSSLKTSLDLFNELIRAGCKGIVAAGTCAEYAPSRRPLREESPTGPATLYAASKLSCLLAGRQLAGLGKIRFAWGRIFYPYGPQEDGRRLVPAALRALLAGKSFPATKGDQVRDYVHVEDVAAAFCRMAEKRADGVFNVASGEPVTIRRLLETLGRLTGRGDLIRFGAKPRASWEPPVLTGDNKKMKSLGWKPAYSLEKGLDQTVQRFKAHPG